MSKESLEKELERQTIIHDYVVFRQNELQETIKLLKKQISELRND